MKSYTIIVECAIEYDHKFLMIKRPNGSSGNELLTFPGGKVDELDEDKNIDVLLQALKREVFEEVGLDLHEPIQFITSSYFIGQEKHVIDAIFYCKLNKLPPRIMASSREVAEYYWLTYDEIINAPNAPDWLKKYMNEVIKEKNKVE